MISNMTKRLFKPMQDDQRGAIGGIPEQVIAIAVGVLLVAGMIALGSKAFSASKANQELANLNQVMNGVRSIYAARNNFVGLDGATVINSGVAPNQMIDQANAGALLNVWGRPVTVQDGDSGIGIPGTFEIITTGIPGDGCVSLLTKTPAEGVEQVVVAGGAGDTWDADELPVDPAEATTACDPGAQGQNDITWVIR